VHDLGIFESESADCQRHGTTTATGSATASASGPGMCPSPSKLEALAPRPA
jgi:hypothetical protein